MILFDIEHCFVFGKSGPVALGETLLADLASAHPPTIDARADDGSPGSPFVLYRDQYGVGEFRLFDTGGKGRVTDIHINVDGHELLRRRLDHPDGAPAELDCGPFRIRMHEKSVEAWLTLVDALAAKAIEPTRPAMLSSDPRSDLRILNVDWRLRERHLHLAFEPRLVPNPNLHACQVRFEYCIERVRLFAPGFGPLLPM